MSKIIRNPDDKQAAAVLLALKENGGYCPCKLEKRPENQCICLEFREQESGLCHCGLYIKAK